MRSSLLLTVLVVSAAVLGCDSDGAASEPLAAPGPDAYTLAVEVDDSGDERRAAGPARYVLSDLPREAGHRTATLTLSPDRPGGVEVSVALYVSQDGTAVFPAPGSYAVADTRGAPFVVTAEIDGRIFSAYRGTVTIEAASETEVAGRLDIEVTTGGCAYLPTCDGPTRTGVLQARFRAAAQPAP